MEGLWEIKVTVQTQGFLAPPCTGTKVLAGASYTKGQVGSGLSRSSVIRARVLLAVLGHQEGMEKGPWWVVATPLIAHIPWSRGDSPLGKPGVWMPPPSGTSSSSVHEGAGEGN